MPTASSQESELRDSEAPAPPATREFDTTTRRTMTRRGVMWLGQTCNARCYFCYFLERIGDAQHPEHPFMTLEKAKALCTTLREVYGNTSIDIQGGEPTIHPDIFELIRHCRDIGLYPTLITNGLALPKPGLLEKFKEAGVRDFLVSLHGMGEIHDQVVGRKGASGKIIAAIERMVELDIPFRFNCTMSKPVIPLLPDIARKAVEYGACAVNYIAFNPFGDQETGVRTGENVPEYLAIRPKLAEALDILEEAGIETNVRYLPLCMAEEKHRKNFYNFQQLTYDHHEWDFQSWLWTMMQPQMMKEGGFVPPILLGVGASKIYRGYAHRARDAYAAHPVIGRIALKLQHAVSHIQQVVLGKERMMRDEGRFRAVHDCKYKYDDSCGQCAARNICDGFHGDYAEFFGTGAAEPITGIAPIDDPLHYIRQQVKVVEKEDKAWAL